jgi:glucose-6-phosphate 1-epimerase
VLWNPAAKAGGAIGDLHEGGWQDFICWEPGVISDLRWLAPGETWEGRQLMTAV